ncbi:glutamyl-tRNA(Gln) amidotransferase subunit B, mitochondrial-like [Uloborus diversus]|uniref:glutamyl-tRNA(Gln) amidotransferase subunit B, mitochondrial-like n=1 Tax=Uloborus diversus TaxID=327109 RepID=UPI00240A3E4A|nr:glutamyl-tRNA(Gln) amidotransferase subunit B, mitochondrial-like [Uloborus diversus]
MTFLKRLPKQIFYSCKRLSSNKTSNSKWETVVGLEIHAQINAKSKLFSSAGTNFGAPTNTEVSYFDAAIPGTLPVLNKYCVEAGILTALALNCTVNKKSTFDRKHYFYPDLPAGYQITQQFNPLANNGYITFVVCSKSQGDEPYECRCNLKQIQLEQDSGRSFHVANKKSFVDLNRVGIGLMELVFEPDLRNGIEASSLVKELMLILRKINTCSCEMEEGALRVDANISVNQVGESLGVRTEVKNINSLRFIAQAIDFEISRQINILEKGGIVSNETRAFDYHSKETVYMRDKEALQDYRFMPEPNLPPIRLSDDVDATDDYCISVNKLREKLPKLPSVERAELMSKYKVPYNIADIFVSTDGLRSMFETIACTVPDVMYISNFLLNNVQHQLNIRKLTFKNW